MTVWLELRGTGDSPKGPKRTGWNEPLYRGEDIDALHAAGKWVGRRLDDDVVIDCDDDESMLAWLGHLGAQLDHTWVRKTPNGYHFYYRRTDARVTARKLTAKSELKTGVGHQVVFQAPGYYDLVERPAIAFQAEWLPPEAHKPQVEEWTDLPEGMRNSFLTSVGGLMRNWGADQGAIEAALISLNEALHAGLWMREVRAIARSLLRYEPAERDTIECPKCGTELEVL